jgi:UDP-glucuronate decarboxylase
MQRKPDITLARTKLGWEPKIKLEAGLRRTIAYFDALLKRGVDAPALAKSTAAKPKAKAKKKAAAR